MTGPTRPALWRPRAGCLTSLDVVAACGCAALAFVVLVESPGRDGIALLGGFPVAWGARLVAAGLLAACLAAPVAARRRAAVPALMVVLAACLVMMLLGGEIIPAGVVPLALVVYMVAVTHPRKVAALALGAALAVVAVQGLLMSLSQRGAGNALAAGLLLIICWVVGYSVRQRRAYALRLQEQAAAAAVTEERLRIARELHDVVAHSMTVAAVQAGFGEYVFDSQPAQARAALGAIQAVTRDALADMQRLLGVLRHAAPGPSMAVGAPAAAAAVSGAPGTPAAGPAPLVPAPGLADLDRLAATTSGAGVQVDIKRTGQERLIPPGVDLSAFRIVQEALTNVVKHSGAATCLVAVDYGPRQLSVEVTDPGHAGPGGAPPDGDGQSPGTGHPAGTGQFLGNGHSPGGGHGLIGMAERVQLCGGQFSAGPLPAGGFGVRAHLPLPPASPP